VILKELTRPASDGAALGQPADIRPDWYAAALFKGDRQVTPWVVGPPCEFGVIKRNAANRYKIRIPDGRVYAGPLPALPTGGKYTMSGPFRWADDGTFWPVDLVRES
jgi:hypothetical protein